MNGDAVRAVSAALPYDGAEAALADGARLSAVLRAAAAVPWDAEEGCPISASPTELDLSRSGVVDKRSTHEARSGSGTLVSAQ